MHHPNSAFYSIFRPWNPLNDSRACRGASYELLFFSRGIKANGEIRSLFESLSKLLNYLLGVRSYDTRKFFRHQPSLWCFSWVSTKSFLNSWNVEGLGEQKDIFQTVGTSINPPQLFLEFPIQPRKLIQLATDIGKFLFIPHEKFRQIWCFPREGFALAENPGCWWNTKFMKFIDIMDIYRCFGWAIFLL